MRRRPRLVGGRRRPFAGTLCGNVLRLDRRDPHDDGWTLPMPLVRYHD